MHAPQAPPSSAHWKVAPPSGDENETVASAEFVERGRSRVDRDRGGGRVGRPAVGGRRARVPGRVGGLDRERVRALGQAALRERRGAGRERCAVERAEEARAAVRRREREGRRRRGGRVARLGVDRRRRGGRVDRPRLRVGGALVAGGVGRADLEGVRAVAEAGERVRRGARGPGARVELALEGRRLAGREREARRRVVRLRRPGRVDRRGRARSGRSSSSRVAGALVEPAVSVVRTAKSCAPAARPL